MKDRDTNLQDLKKLKQKDMVTGLDIDASREKFDCEVCFKGKISKLPYQSSTTRAKEKMEIVYSNICGPMNVESIGGYKYFVTFLDDRTRYTEVTMLKQRSDALDAFQNYLKRAKRQTGKNIKILRTDNAREYVSKEFSQFLEHEGIQRQLSVEYTPQMALRSAQIEHWLRWPGAC